MKPTHVPIIALALALSPSLAMARAPDVSRCPPPEQPAGGEIDRTQPIVVPPAFRSIVSSSRYNMAIATLTGARICLDVSWRDNHDNWQLTPDGRFLTYTWYGYETYGQDLVDRRGAGKVTEIGQPPVFSATRRRFAAIDLNEAENGALTGLAVWQVGPTDVMEIGRIDTIPRLDDWRVDGWVGEACVNLSARPYGSEGTARRMRYTARATARGWRLARAPRGCGRR